MNLRPAKRKKIKRKNSKPATTTAQKPSVKTSMLHKTASALKSKYSAFVSLRKLEPSPEKKKRRASEMKQKDSSDICIAECVSKDSSETAREIVAEKIKELAAKSRETTAENGLEEVFTEKKVESADSDKVTAKQDKYIKSNIVDQLASKIQAISGQDTEDTTETQNASISETSEEISNHSESTPFDVSVIESIGNPENQKSEIKNDESKVVSEKSDVASKEMENDKSCKTNESLLAVNEQVVKENIDSSENIASDNDSSVQKDDKESLSEVANKTASESPASKEEYRKKLESTILSCKAKLGMTEEDSLSDLSDGDSEESDGEESDSGNEDDEKVLTEKSDESSQDSLDKTESETKEQETKLEMENTGSSSAGDKINLSNKENEIDEEQSENKLQEENAPSSSIDVKSPNNNLPSLQSTDQVPVETINAGDEDKENTPDVYETVSETKEGSKESECCGDEDKEGFTDHYYSEFSNNADNVSPVIEEQTAEPSTEQISDVREKADMGIKLLDPEMVVSLSGEDETVSESVKEKPVFDIDMSKDENPDSFAEKSSGTVKDDCNTDKIDEKLTSKAIEQNEKSKNMGTVKDNAIEKADIPFENTGMLMEVDNASDTDSESGKLMIDLDAEKSSPVVTPTETYFKEGEVRLKKSPEKKHKQTTPCPTKKVLKEKLLKSKSDRREIKDSDVIMVSDGLDSSPEKKNKTSPKKKKCKECRDPPLQASR